MPLTITLPNILERKLHAKAAIYQQPIDKLTIDFLSRALDDEPDDYFATGGTLATDFLVAESNDYPTLEEVVAKIKATPPNPAMIEPAKESLLEYLLDSPPLDPSFDLEEWNREWAKVEAELKAMDPLYNPTEEILS